MLPEKLTEIELKGCEYIASFIQEQDIDIIFGLTGGYIHHTIDAICEKSKINFITVHHEQAASFAADGYSRISGKPGICMGLSGPGGINMLAGIAHAYYDSYPIICITGQVNLNEMVGERKIRQHGFQECDIVSIMKSVTKNSHLVRDGSELAKILHESFQIALNDRKGPCLIDIPLNIQCSTYKYCIPKFIAPVYQEMSEILRIQIRKLLYDISHSKKPMFLLGGGINSSNTSKLVRELVNIIEVPCVHSLLACDIIPYSHPSYLGMIGTYGLRVANNMLMESDTLVVLGSRLDLRQTGSETKSFENRNIYQIDIDKEEVNFRIKGVNHVHIDLYSFLKEAITQAKTNKTKCDCVEWFKIINENKRKYPHIMELTDLGYNNINPNLFMDKLSVYSQKYKTHYTTGIGNVQMWAAQSIKLVENQRLLIPGGLSSMGSGLPMAIGACLALKNTIPYVVVEGDGGIQLNIQELQTIVRNNLPIKIVIMNNSSLGMLRQFCLQNFNSRFNQIQPGFGYDNPDFLEIAKAYKINSYRVETTDDIENALYNMWLDPMEPYILDVKIPIETYVAPKVPYGNSLNDMIPVIQGEYPIAKKEFIILK